MFQFGWKNLLLQINICINLITNHTQLYKCTLQFTRYFNTKIKGRYNDEMGKMLFLYILTVVIKIIIFPTSYYFTKSLAQNVYRRGIFQQQELGE